MKPTIFNMGFELGRDGELRYNEWFYISYMVMNGRGVLSIRQAPVPENRIRVFSHCFAYTPQDF